MQEVMCEGKSGAVPGIMGSAGTAAVVGETGGGIGDPPPYAPRRPAPRGRGLRAILVTCGCCCIPCVRSLTQRPITRAVAGDGAGVMMPLLEIREGDGYGKGPKALHRVECGESL
ncbi:unnamed protein product [Arctogadus glacialis]